jgi:hypothetical protein
MDISKELSSLKDSTYESIVILRKELEKEQEESLHIQSVRAWNWIGKYS